MHYRLHLWRSAPAEKYSLLVRMRQTGIGTSCVGREPAEGFLSVDAVADLRGRQGRVPLNGGPNSFIFMQFSAKKMQNNRLAHPFWELAGSATAMLGLIRNESQFEQRPTEWNTRAFLFISRYQQFQNWPEKKDEPSQWWIQDFPQGVRQLPKVLLFFNFFAENCMEMREFGPRGVSLATPLDPPIHLLKFKIIPLLFHHIKKRPRILCSMKESLNIRELCLPIGGSIGGARDAPPGGPYSFIFMQFLAKKLKNRNAFQ